MKTLFIVLAVIFCVSIILAQVMYHITDNRYGYPQVFFANEIQRWLYFSSIGITYIISVFGWFSVFVFTHEIQMIRPLLWSMLVSGVIIIIANISARSDYEDPVPGCFLSACNTAFAVTGLFAV